MTTDNTCSKQDSQVMLVWGLFLFCHDQIATVIRNLKHKHNVYSFIYKHNVLYKHEIQNINIMKHFNVS